MHTIAPEQLHQRLSAGQPVALIDVRTPEEFRDVRVAAARNVPLDRLDDPREVAQLQQAAGGGPLYFICHLGMRSARACEILSAAGFPRAVNVVGGTDAWIAAGLPVASGPE